MTDPVLAWWDLAALTVIIPEAGGTITTWDGEPEHIPNESGHYSAIASNGRFHDELVRTLHP
jgi:fructose-1,6-bisphosphatase/inositol monophosphatase family enzyme